MPRCEHGLARFCRSCHPHTFCPHGRQPARCRPCAGASFCAHGRQASQCRACGGSSFCPHQRRRGTCGLCRGSQVCAHGRIRGACAACSPLGNLIKRVRTATRHCFAHVARRKDARTLALLGCSPVRFKAFIVRKMLRWNAAAKRNATKRMTWQNIHLDHIRPVCSMRSTLDPDVLHYTNFQPLLAEHNLSKGARWGPADEAFWRAHVRGNPHFEDIYMPAWQ
jgi:hypothetical protein